MIPKLDNCFYALNKGVKSVGIGNTQMLLPENNTYTSITL
jgi:acetylglutamate kinase